MEAALYSESGGGSMIWFGSSTGVALSNMFPETKSVISYIRFGWYVILAYLVGFFILPTVLGWHPAEEYEEFVPLQNTVTEMNP
jgi:hypothetical protein